MVTPHELLIKGANQLGYPEAVSFLLDIIAEGIDTDSEQRRADEIECTQQLAQRN